MWVTDQLSGKPDRYSEIKEDASDIVLYGSGSLFKNWFSVSSSIRYVIIYVNVC